MQRGVGLLQEREQHVAQNVLHVERFPAYRANIVAYLVAYLSYRSGGRLDLEEIWQKQDVSDALRKLLRSWSHNVNSGIVESARGRNVTEWCKKEQCWDHVRALALDLPAALPPEIQSADGGVAGKPSEPVSHEDLENMDRCRQVDGATWLKIHAWGTRTGLLKGWQAGIAHTLAGYAANNWSRAPSSKQARPPRANVR
jgi:hypothetical protein